MNRRGLIAIVSVCLIGASAWQVHGWIDRREATRANSKLGRETARTLINGGYLHIAIGQGMAWRPTYERILSERFGLKFYHPPKGSCGYRGDIDAMESAMKKAMDEEVARRFKPGELERLADEAERIYRDQQTEETN